MGLGWSQEEERARKPGGKPKEPPHNYQDIIQEADFHDFYDRLQAGLFLNQNKRKYWVEENTGHKCLMMFARELSITWSDTPTYWRWHLLKETSNAYVEVADLVEVCWLEVKGKFKTSNLSPGTDYEVAFVVMMKDPSYGWALPVNLRLVCPDGQVQEHHQVLEDKPTGQWMELHVGVVASPREKSGEIQLSLQGSEGTKWKKGLVIKGAIIRPTK